MKSLLKAVVLIGAAVFLTGCELLVWQYDSPVYMEIDGKPFENESFKSVPSGMVPGSLEVEGTKSFSFDFGDSMSGNAEYVNLYFKVTMEESLEIGRRYQIILQDSEYRESSVPNVIYKNKGFYATEGWVVFHDICLSGQVAMVSGSFEFVALSEDGTGQIQVTKGSFDQIPTSYSYHKQVE